MREVRRITLFELRRRNFQANLLNWKLLWTLTSWRESFSVTALKAAGLLLIKTTHSAFGLQLSQMSAQASPSQRRNNAVRRRRNPRRERLIIESLLSLEFSGEKILLKSAILQSQEEGQSTRPLSPLSKGLRSKLFPCTGSHTKRHCGSQTRLSRFILHTIWESDRTQCQKRV